MGLKHQPTPPSEQVELDLTLHRCPFCHDDVGRLGSVACQGCLARHHDACWNESGHCGACGDATALRAPTRLTPELAIEALVAQGYAQAEAEALFDAAPPTAPRSAIGWLVGIVFFFSGAGMIAEAILSPEAPLFLLGPGLMSLGLGAGLLWLFKGSTNAAR